MSAGKPSPTSTGKRRRGGSRRGVSRRQLLYGIVLIAVAVILARTLSNSWHAMISAWRSVGVLDFVLALLLGLLSVLFNAGAWGSVLAGLGVRIPPVEMVRVFCVSQLGKYLPGSVWPVVAQMAAGRRHGGSKAAMVAANLLNVVVSLCVGLVLACILLPVGDPSLLRRYWWVMFAVVPLLAMLHPRAFTSVLDQALKLLKRPAFNQPLPVSASLRSAGWAAGSWLLQGLHLYVLCAALGYSGWRPLLLSIGSMAAAVCVGLLAIPVPAGAGVREAVLAVTLTTVLQHKEIAAIVVASRALMILADLLAAAFATIGSTGRPHESVAQADLE